jgi:hypothetical protein
MKLAAPLFSVALPLLVASCSRPDDFYCPPPSQVWWCEAICAVEMCDGTIMESRSTAIRLCASDELEARVRFWQTVHDPTSGLRDCTVPKCTSTHVTAGAGYGPHGEAESAASGDPWQLPPWEGGCL